MTPLELFASGKLSEAIASALESVRAKPADVGRRWELCEMLCFTGDLERVDKHLDAISQQDPAAAMSVALFRQLVRAEGLRQQFFSEGRLPEFFEKPDEELTLRLQASICLREGKSAEALKLLEDAEAARVRLSGSCDGAEFADMRDLDDLCASFMEVLTPTGKYYWVPLKSIRQMEVKPPGRARDLLWRLARMELEGGPDGDVYLPALYIGSQSHPDERVQLGRATEWTGEADSLVRGAGQRMFLVGEESRGIGQIKLLEVNAP
jgi:type VI secretion system protein ImpE